MTNKMNSLVEMVKNIAGYSKSVPTNDQQDIDPDLNEYISYAKKYADTNSDTQHIEQLMLALNEMNIHDNGKMPLPKKPSADAQSQQSDEKQKQLESNQPAVKVSHVSRHYENMKRQINLMEELTVENMLVGPSPYEHKSKFRSADRGGQFKLQFYDVPAKLYNHMMSNTDVGLSRPLDKSCYVEKFQKLLWVEEASHVVQMRNYDQFDVILAKYENNAYILYVPGLAEGRPSLMKGDSLILKSEKRSSVYKGYIFEVRERDILFRLHDSIGDVQGLHFDVMFKASRTPFRRCHHGVTQLRNNEALKKVVFPEFNEDMPKPFVSFKESGIDELRCFDTRLNRYQRQAIMNSLKSLCRPSPYIIFGPPGTGKTNTLVEAVLQFYARSPGSKILVCANSNASTDLLARRIQASGSIPKNKMVRVAAFYRIEDNLVPEDLIDISKDMDMLNDYQDYRVVITTCIQSGALYEFKDRFDHVFLDEAGHANEAEAMISLGLMKPSGCCTLAGDHQQLGPVCLSNLAKANGLGTSLLERLTGLPVYKAKTVEGKPLYKPEYISKLLISYRSDSRVMVLNNKLFYDNELQFTNRTPERWLQLLKSSNPLIFHNVIGKEKREYLNPSWFNPNEAIKCLTYARILYSHGLKPDQLGIVTPYRRQIDKIKTLFASANMIPCKVATMEEFQGDEREVILISTVRSSQKSLKLDKQFNLGFLFDRKRFNVSVSRAKWLVIVLGDRSILGLDPYWTEYMKVAHVIEDLATGIDHEKKMDQPKASSSSSRQSASKKTTYPSKSKNPSSATKPPK